MKKILIAIDYNQSAQKVAEQGYALAKAMQASIILIHVIEDVMYYSSQSYDPIMGFGGFVNVNFLGPDLLEHIEKEANDFLEKTKLHLKDDKIHSEVLHGTIHSTIVEKAESEHCDLIVMGTHSRKWMEEILLGSTAHKLLKHSKIPLFIIPNKQNI